jgi:lactate dehydrogenase-like 2-hydroxyacid dehydrogenase
VVALYVVGVDHVDLDTAARHAVTITLTPGANANAVAELVMAFVFSMVRRLVDDRDQICSPILETAPTGLAGLCGEGYKRYQGAFATLSPDRA